MSEKINHEIRNSNFKAAHLFAADLNCNELHDVIFDVAYDKPTLATYSFIISILIQKQNSQKHDIAAELLSLPLCFYAGAYSVALFHARKAITLDPANIEYKTFLILFHDIPEQLINAEEAYQLAIEILNIDPSVTVAQNIIKKYEKGLVDNDISDLPVSKISALLNASITKKMYLLLYYAKFEEARELVNNISFDELFKLMTTISQQEQTLTLYGYIVNLLFDNETAALHHLASRVLMELLNSIEGADVSGYWHARRAVELAPEITEYKQWLHKLNISSGML